MLRPLGMTIALLLAGPGAIAADNPYPSQVSYAIYRDGQQIGRHIFVFGHRDAVKTVAVDCEVEVRTLGVVAYRYSHRGHEEWKGDQLELLRATTDDNGRRFTIAAERRDGKLVVERTVSPPTSAALADQGYRGPDVTRQILPGNLLPTSGWNVGQVHQTSLLNTQNGKVAHVRVTPAGREAVKMPGGSVSATRYRYTGDLRLEQWFDDRGRWVKGSFAAFDGSAIEYILQE